MNNNQFKAAMAKLPEPPSDSSPPLWDYWRHELWSRVVNTDNPEAFFAWAPIFHTMLVNHWIKPNKKEFKYLEPDLDRWDEAITMPEFGHPKDFYEDTKYSRNLIHQAYHIKRWEKATKTKLENCGKIVEFGGGYGAMAYLIHKLGFDGEYTIYDLPEFELLQDYYLWNAGKIKVKHSKSSNKIADLYIACYSLSEVPTDERLSILSHDLADNYLFLYSNKFATFDNILGMQTEVPKFLSDYKWKHSKIEHLPPESWYSFGWL
jgi:hypothetical protein